MKRMFLMAAMGMLNYVRACLRSANLKRALVCSCLLAALATAAEAQKVYGDRPGWSVHTVEDEYTGKVSYSMRYYDQQRVLTASFFPGRDRMAILEWYDGRLYFDVTFDAVMDHRGHIADEEIGYEWRVASAKGEPSEGSGTVKLSFGDVEKAGETFFGTFIFDADLDAMMAGQTIAVRWHDPIKGKEMVRKVSLSGFTRCYDKVLRRYGAKRKK